MCSSGFVRASLTVPTSLMRRSKCLRARVHYPNLTVRRINRSRTIVKRRQPPRLILSACTDYHASEVQRLLQVGSRQFGGALSTNQDYYDRWEASAPTPVAGTLTPEEIAKHQGTRLRPDEAWWETYGQELGTEDPALIEAIAEYAGRVSDAAPSQESLETLAERKEFNDKTAQEYQFV